MVQKNLGRFCREKQYADFLEKLLKKEGVEFGREVRILDINQEFTGNQPDFIIENQIILDTKAKQFITKEDYFQMQRYLKSSHLELGLIVNFRSSHLKPNRVLNSEFYSDNSGAHSNNSGRQL